MKVHEIRECLRSDNCLSAREVTICTPSNHPGLVSNGEHRVLTVHLFEIRVDCKFMGACNGALQASRRAFLHVFPALGCHQYAADGVVIKSGTDEFTRNAEG